MPLALTLTLTPVAANTEKWSAVVRAASKHSINRFWYGLPGVMDCHSALPSFDWHRLAILFSLVP
ncbi:hypothetical protein AAG612_12325 [Citromicrobium bathyomarinum]|uniref:hypothetical protein n=1 Tax=Citromicrobium bathyomarinum TaxID=72174 RepID=UPI00315A371F